jgi:predicted phosphodiesterase
MTDNERLLDFIEQGKTYAEIANIFNCTERTITRRVARIKNIKDEDIANDITKAKEKQKYNDIFRLERKSFRDGARVENSVLEYSKELVSVFKNYKLPAFVISKKTVVNDKSSGVIHITDAHLNELVDLSINKYDFKIASKRFKKLANEAKIEFKARGIKNVLIAMTGDLMNSDRRIEELLAQATNRSKATFLSVSILEQFILDLAQDFNISVASVIGNESRVGKDVSWDECLASDNYDYTIFNILKLIFRKSNVIFFDGHSVEQMVEVCGQNILLIHGNQLQSNAMEQSIQKIKGKYTSRNIQIDFVLSGHLHSCRIGETFARGGSVVGANAYSDIGLQLESRASQNLHIFYANGNRNSIKIDLQNVNDIEGYNVEKELEAYNAKSLVKTKKKIIVNRII